MAAGDEGIVPLVLIHNLKSETSVVTHEAPGLNDTDVKVDWQEDAELAAVTVHVYMARLAVAGHRLPALGCTAGFADEMVSA